MRWRSGHGAASPLVDWVGQLNSTLTMLLTRSRLGWSPGAPWMYSWLVGGGKNMFGNLKINSQAPSIRQATQVSSRIIREV